MYFCCIYSLCQYILKYQFVLYSTINYSTSSKYYVSYQLQLLAYKNIVHVDMFIKKLLACFNLIYLSFALSWKVLKCLHGACVIFLKSNSKYGGKYVVTITSESCGLGEIQLCQNNTCFLQRPSVTSHSWLVRVHSRLVVLSNLCTVQQIAGRA